MQLFRGQISTGGQISPKTLNHDLKVATVLRPRKLARIMTSAYTFYVGKTDHFDPPTEAQSLLAYRPLEAAKIRHARGEWDGVTEPLVKYTIFHNDDDHVLRMAHHLACVTHNDVVMVTRIAHPREYMSTMRSTRRYSVNIKTATEGNRTLPLAGTERGYLFEPSVAGNGGYIAWLVNQWAGVSPIT